MKLLILTRALAQFATAQNKFREISRLGADLTVVSPARWAGTDRELLRVRADGYEVRLHKCWVSSTRSIRWGNHLYFYPGISRIIGGETWDLVLIDEEPFNLATYHSLRASFKRRIPTIFTTYQNIDKSYPPPFNFFERYVFEHASGAIAFNSESLDVLRRRGFSRLAAYIPTGVDSTVFRKQDAAVLRRDLAPEGSFVVGFVGRIDLSKGLDTLVRAFALLPENSVLVLAGSGPYEASLNRLALSLGLTERIRWVPWVDSGRVAEYMNAFDVLVLPSRTCSNWKEQFGRVLAEAMSCETCVVGSDSGDIPNVIGDAGIVFHEGKEHELAGHIRRLMGDHLLRKNLGCRGRQRVLEHFSYQKIARDSVDFYARICSSVNEMKAMTI